MGSGYHYQSGSNGRISKSLITKSIQKGANKQCSKQKLIIKETFPRFPSQENDRGFVCPLRLLQRVPEPDRGALRLRQRHQHHGQAVVRGGAGHRALEDHQDHRRQLGL